MSHPLREETARRYLLFSVITTPEQFGFELVWSQIYLKELTFQWLFRIWSIIGLISKTFLYSGRLAFLSGQVFFSVGRNFFDWTTKQKQRKRNGSRQIQITILPKFSKWCLDLFRRDHNIDPSDLLPWQPPPQSRLLLFFPSVLLCYCSTATMVYSGLVHLALCRIEWRHRPSKPECGVWSC